MKRGSLAHHEAAAPFSVAQGLYYLATGLWPLVSIDTFHKVTGPKTDLWLVKTVGGLLGVIGGVLLSAGLQQRVTTQTASLALGSAAFLSAVEVVYVAQRRISPVYLLDAVAELALIAMWLGAGTKR